MSIRAAVEGLVLTTYKEKGYEYDIRVLLKDDTLLTLNDLRNIPIATPNGIQLSPTLPIFNLQKVLIRSCMRII
jgi:multidrug efflux pump subunit AcrB